MATSLPTDIDATYPDDGDASRKTHQQHHDSIHGYTNTHDTATDPHGDRAYADGKFITAAQAPVQTVFTRSGAITAAAADYADFYPQPLAKTTAGAAAPLPWRNVKDYGATGDGSTDDTAAIQAALDAVPVSGGCVCFPPGTYVVASALTISNPGLYYGCGYGSLLKTNSATADILDVGNTTHVDIAGLNFQSSVTRTGGWYINNTAGGSRVRVRNCYLSGAYGGVVTSGTTFRLIETEILDCVAGTGTAVEISGGVDVKLERVLVDAAAQISSGVLVTDCGDLTIDSCQLIHAGVALNISASAGKAVTSVWALNTFFDTSSFGVSVDAPGGTAARIRFTDCWMSSATSEGVSLSTSAGGSVDGVQIINCDIFGNASNGIAINDAGVTNVAIIGCNIAGHAGNSGVAVIVGGVTHFRVQDCRIGPCAGYGANADGIYVAGGASDYYLITGNDVSGNTTAIADSGTGTHKVVANNLT